MIHKKFRKKLVIFGLALCTVAFLIIYRRRKIKPLPTGEISVKPESLKWCPPFLTEALAKHEFCISKEIPYYIDGLVILTGTGPDIDEIANRVGLDSKEYEIARVGDDLENRLYKYDQGRFGTVWDVIMAVQTAALRQGSEVKADPDYVINPIPITGNPWRVEGSPWRVEGSLDAMIGTITGVPPSETDFWGQWGLNEIQGSGFLTGSLPDSRQGCTGAGTRVVIFDTSPFRNPGSYSFEFEYEKSMELCVSHPQNPSPLADVSNRNDHGLFVAGLVHAAAPHSKIHLIRVLNERVAGDLFTLITALSALIERGSLEKTVINLSLGLNPEDSAPPPNYTALFHLDQPRGDLSPREALQEWRERIHPEGEVPPEFTDDEDFQSYLCEILPQLSPAELIPVFALNYQLSAARKAGAVIVAAAGNDSKPGAIKPAQIPAAWDYVIGVGAANQSKVRSCYSNTGDVYAPGGDGIGEKCDPAFEQCIDETCKYGVISLASVPLRELRFGFGYWVGSSFAAPLVSGLAAQLFNLPNLTNDAIEAELKSRFQGGIQPGVTNIGP